ncbi:hypothetical protein ACQR1I_35530 [Bradyrhizobium sp. HKCCYLS2038]|uniref:hypothetical protein n=1 Tax=unclassified Bradyrhizobium TaxID=2631580 RepID=UPI003EB89CA7
MLEGRTPDAVTRLARQHCIHLGALPTRRLEKRYLLGRIGPALEREFGTDLTRFFFVTRDLAPGGYYSFGSVRRNAVPIEWDVGI